VAQSLKSDREARSRKLVRRAIGGPGWRCVRPYGIADGEPAGSSVYRPRIADVPRADREAEGDAGALCAFCRA